LTDPAERDKGIMSWQEHPWEKIYAREGRVFDEPIPGFSHVIDFFRAKGCKRILDVGCGSGRHAVRMAEEGFSAIGVDISSSALHLALGLAAERCLVLPVLQSDVRKCIPFASSTFEGVISTQVIHHAILEEVRRAIEEIHRVMCPGGYAFITVPAMKDNGGPSVQIEPGTYIPQNGWEAGLPHHHFTEEELAAELAVFEILEVTRRAEGKVLASWARKR
jgi:SAM-dependent methyltransferase